MSNEHHATAPLTAIERSDRAADLAHPQEQSSSFLDAIRRAAADPQCDVDKMERLLAMTERMMADERRTAFVDAMARLQGRLPQITKSGVIFDSVGKERNRWAKLEDIDVAVRPLLAEEGFSFSYDSKAAPTGIEYTCTLSHRSGHSERRTMVLPLDTGAGRNAVQSAGSSLSYARRYLLSMHLNLITRDQDNDGAGESAPITAEQAAQLRKELQEIGGTESRFIAWLRVPTLEELPAYRFRMAQLSLEERRRTKEGAR